MSHQVALNFEDGVTRVIACDENQKVADASYRSGINIPVDCRDGACGTCKAFHESGDFDGGSYIEEALSAEEEEAGYVLTCQMRPKSDLVLQILTTSEVAKTSAASHRGSVTAVDRLSPSTFALTIEIDDRDELVFLPGQYVNITVPGTEETRSYSFSSGPEDKTLSFLVKISPGGVMSEYLESRAAVGDEVSLTGPHGSFFLRESDAPLLLLAGGTGLAPILSIMRKMAASADVRTAHLIYGATTDDDVIELEAIEELAGSIGSLTWDYCVADENTTAPNQGYVTTLIGSEEIHDGQAAVYLCGPPPMVEAVRGYFDEQGFTPSGFYYEKFALAAAPDTDEDEGEAGAAGEAAEPEPGAEAPEADTLSGSDSDSGSYSDLESESEPTGRPTRAPAAVAGSDRAELLTLGGREGRSLRTQVMLTDAELAPLAGSGTTASTDGPSTQSPATATARQLLGQVMAPADGSGGSAGEPRPLDEGGVLISGGARTVRDQEMLPAAEIEALVPPEMPVPAPAPVSGSTDRAVSEDGYVIGEEHPPIHESDAIFEAREALELGAVELTVGRLNSQQLHGYRRLAELTLPYVEEDRFVDAAEFTETNAAFHDYLFTLTRNDHLRRAYRALDVQGYMAESLRHATWCHPQVAQDHVDIVDAFEAGDRDAVRTLVHEHAERSKETTRRAIGDREAARRPRFVTPGRFDGQVVLVTGADQGIGERTARRISAEGGCLVLADRAEHVHDLARELADSGPDALGVGADLETWEGAESVVSAALERFGRIDVAIHTVGGTIWAKPFEHYPPEEIQAEIARSLWPTLWGCRAVAPHMIERGAGTIVNVSSVATRGLNRVPYAAAKGGVNAITSALALELAEHGIRVVATAPGGTEAPARRNPRGPEPDSEQEQAWSQTIVDQTTDSSLMKRYGTLDEQAAAITFLASEEASYITATVLPVAGGDQG